jgi:hypothetical protein
MQEQGHYLPFPENSQPHLISPETMGKKNKRMRKASNFITKN